MIDEHTLRQLYLVEKHSIQAIATQVGLSIQTVRDLLGRYHIPRRLAGFQPSAAHDTTLALDEPTLRQLYLAEERSIREIAARYGISTRSVYDALVRFRIPRRSGGYRKSAAPAPADDNPLDEITLRRLYEQEGATIAAIAQAMACSPSRVRHALVRLGIPRRRRGRRDTTSQGA